MTTLDELQHYVEDRKWWVFPVYKVRDGRCACRSGALCDAPGKHPMVRNGVKEATFQPGRIVRWFEQFPDCNWAVATGESSRLWVLDIDAHSASGVDSMREWLDHNGVTLPETFTVRTGGGGWHYYFALDQPMKNKTGVLPGVDVRAQGGYVLLPGSSHISGQRYEVARDTPVASAPAELVSFLQTAGGSGNGSGGGRSIEIGDTADLRSEGFRLGYRDDGFNALAWRLVRLHYPHIDLVRQIAYEVWLATDNPPTDPFPWNKVEYQIARAVETVGPDVEAQYRWAERLRSTNG